MALKTGDQAPDFTLTSDENKPISLSQFRGKKVVIYFYPKDNTPGCTKEACDFRDNYQQLTDKNVEILGISKDSVKKHQNFKHKHELPFTLLVDDEGSVCETYGVIKPKSMFGKSFLGIQRATFLVDEQGKIAAVWPKVKINGHVEQILNELN